MFSVRLHCGQVGERGIIVKITQVRRPAESTCAGSVRFAQGGRLLRLAEKTGCVWSRQILPSTNSIWKNLSLEPHGHKSFRPSFSESSLFPWTMRTPLPTRVSDGKPLRRLLVISKFESSECWYWFAIRSPWLRFAVLNLSADKLFSGQT